MVRLRGRWAISPIPWALGRNRALGDGGERILRSTVPGWKAKCADEGQGYPRRIHSLFFVNTDGATRRLASFYQGDGLRCSTFLTQSAGERPDLVVISPNDPAAITYM